MTGEVLKRLRSIYGYNAKEFSRMINISPSYLSEIENDKKQPNLDLLEKYAKALNLKLSSLILISENFEKSDKTDRSVSLVRNLMLHLIDKLSIGNEDEENN
jgi:transcriptional regulator with XRE-family HTH domain